MTIGIVSDTHRNAKRPQEAIATFHERGIMTVFHLGDVTTAKIVRLFDGFDAYFVYGNADRDLDALAEEVTSLFGEGRLAEWHELTLEGVSLALCHGHTRKLHELSESGRYDIVLHGHTHKRRDEMVGSTRVINPGALGGIKWQSRSYAVLELPSASLEVIETA
ncbi:MAG: YfcE family phosphodiesterase [Spirochaetes bacterium]|nr:YfcE family phosphodiesterase [Spirochaetota bacterium]